MDEKKIELRTRVIIYHEGINTNIALNEPEESITEKLKGNEKWVRFDTYNDDTGAPLVYWVNTERILAFVFAPVDLPKVARAQQIAVSPAEFAKMQKRSGIRQ